MNRRKELVDTIWQLVKSDNAKMPPECKITKSEIEKSVFYREGEHRISGETVTNFSLYYVNYYDLPDLADKLITHLHRRGWDADWYNPAYIVANKEG